MKSSILALFSVLFLVSTDAFSAEVRSAKLDAAQENILIDVTYGGGCKKHNFVLDVSKGCAESFPAQCQATLVDKTKDDFCEALVSDTVTISLKKAGLTDKYYEGARLTITGTSGSASVTLPSKRSNTSPRPSDKTKIACITNAGSALEIIPSAKTISIEAKDGNVSEFKIVGVSSMSLQSMPPVEQTTYKMDDGRSVVISFREGSKMGSGSYIRLDGSYSPEFQSCMKVK